mgnify:FL=1
MTGTTKKKKTPARRRTTSRPQGRLAGKVALVTGAAGNIGVTIVRRFLDEGAAVVMVGRNASKLEATRRQLLKATGAPAARAFVLPFDASDPGQARFGIEAAIRHYGQLDILVNNAGSAGPKQVIEHLPLSREELTSDTETVADAAGNLLGLTWNMVRAAAN